MSNLEYLIDINKLNQACLLFRNKNQFSVDEITEIFSEYGKVVRINSHGGEAGLRFVRYATKDEAMNALINLHKKRFDFMKIEPKAKENNDNNGRDKKKRYYKDKSYGQTEKADSTKGSQSSQKSGDNQKRNNHLVTNGFGCDNNPKYANGEASRERDQNPTRQSVSSRLNRNSGGCADSGEKRVEDKFAMLHKLRGMNANTFGAPSSRAIDASAAQNASIPPLVAAGLQWSQDYATEDSAADDLPPPLIACVPFGPGPKSLEGDKRGVLRAADVVVANIHSNIGVSNVYELFKECRPIYVSDIETVPDINVRYCYVYFETETSALKAEQSFDGISVLGNNLIALRSSRLEAITGIY